MGRTIGAFFAGVFVLFAVVVILQQVAATLHPLPAGLDPMDPAQADAFTRHMESMPTAAWALAFMSELIGAFCGALTAGWIGRDRGRALSAVIVGLALLGSLGNWASFAHPMWFMVGQVVGYPVALMAVWTTLQRRRPPAAAEGRAL